MRLFAIGTASRGFVAALSIGVALAAANLVAQEAAKAPAPKAAAPKAAAPKAAAPSAPAKTAKPPYRELVPGVETTIPVWRDSEETVSTHDIVDLLYGTPNLEWKPNYVPPSKTLAEMSKKVPFRRTIWNLEFTFKPLRMMWIDIPQSNGKMEKKLIWYMVYRVKNTGGHLQPKQRDADETVQVEGAKDAAVSFTLPKGTWTFESVDKVALPYDEKQSPRQDLKFFPLFVLEAYKLKTPKAYTDHVIPVAIPAIQKREDPNRPLLSTVEMARTTIPLSTDRIDRSVWGVVTWEDIDPKANFFSIYIQGLTNAYKWTDDPNAIKPETAPGAGRKFTQRTLKLNFWRPGDEYYQNDREIRFGVPGEVDYEWVWRP